MLVKTSSRVLPWSLQLTSATHERLAHKSHNMQGSTITLLKRAPFATAPETSAVDHACNFHCAAGRRHSALHNLPIQGVSRDWDWVGITSRTADGEGGVETGVAQALHLVHGLWQFFASGVQFYWLQLPRVGQPKVA